MVASNNKKVRIAAGLALANKISLTMNALFKHLKPSKREIKFPGIFRSLEKLPDFDEASKYQIKNGLFQIEKFSLGAVAPDIVGKDQDDKEFKLSDDRGKVFLLDIGAFGKAIA